MEQIHTKRDDSSRRVCDVVHKSDAVHAVRLVIDSRYKRYDALCVVQQI